MEPSRPGQAGLGGQPPATATLPGLDWRWLALSLEGQRSARQTLLC